MKIGYDAKRALMNQSGLGNYSRTLISSLHAIIDEGSMTLFSPNKKSFYFEQLSALKGLRFVITHVKGIWSAIWRSFILGIEASKSDIEIFHGLSAELPPFLGKRIKKVVTIHDLIYERYTDHHHFFDRIIYRSKTKSACRKADKVIAVSEQTRSDLIHFYKIPSQKIEVIYQSVEDSFYHIDFSKKMSLDFILPAKYIICVGSFNWRKNQRNVLLAFESLPPDSSLGLVFVGKGKMQNELMEYAKIKKLQNVFFYSNIEKTSDLIALYTNAYATIIPSFFEGFGIPLIESMACRTPVLCSNIAVFREVCKDASLYFDPSKTSDIALKLSSILYENDLRNQLIELGIQQFKNFDSKKLAEKYLQLYKNVLAN